MCCVHPFSVCKCSIFSNTVINISNVTADFNIHNTITVYEIYQHLPLLHQWVSNLLQLLSFPSINKNVVELRTKNMF